MRINEETVLVGQHVLLVPYRKEHVEQYNTWMQSPTLQEQTASEPLTLQEEYAMQQSWWLDDDKLTFIILALPESASRDHDAKDLIAGSQMIGDINVFLSDPDDDEEEDAPASPSKAKRGELEIMIAEPSARRKGYATEALQMLLWYITANPTPRPCDYESTATQQISSLPLQPQNLFLKISLENQPSISMFKKLGFEEYKVSEVFQEVELRLAAGTHSVGAPPTTIMQWKM